MVVAALALIAQTVLAAPTQPAVPSLELVDVPPWVDVGGSLTLDVAAGAAVDAVTVTVHGRVESPAELADSMEEDEGPVIFTGTFPVADAEVLDDDALRFTFDISDSVNEGTTMRMAFAGVYPVVITPLDAQGNPGTALRTPVIRRSDNSTTLHSPSLSLIVEISAETTITASGERRAFTSDELARFDRLADLIERADPTTAPITVLANADTVAGLIESEASEAKRLTTALTTPGAVVVPQPMVPIDWAVLAASGLDHMIPDLIEEGREIVDPLGTRVDETTWDARGGADVSSLEAIAEAGFERVLVTPAAQSDPLAESVEAEPRDRTIDGAPPLLDVIAVDESTADAVTTPRSGIDAANVAMADLVLRTPDRSTPVAIVLDDIPSDAGLLELLELTAREQSPVRIVPLDGARDDEPTSVEATAPDAEQAAALSQLAPDFTDAEAAIDLHASITGGSDSSGTSARALLAAATRRGVDAEARSTYVAAAAALSSSITDSFRLVGPSALNLTSRTGTLPIAIVNNGPTPVTLALATRSDRLSFPDDKADLPSGPSVDGSGQEWHITTVQIDPGETRIDLPVEALASGSVPLFVELRSPEGSVVLDARTYNVRSTAVSGAGLIISVGALAVLIIWWFRTWRKGRDEPRVTPAPES